MRKDNKWFVDMTRCPFCRSGTLRDNTPRAAEALGVKVVKCDVCGQQIGHKVGGEHENLQTSVG